MSYRALRALCLYAVVALFLTTGCGYGEISPVAYAYAKALYSICNRHAGDQIGNAQQQIESARRRGELSEREARWLTRIIEQARAGKWESATGAARQMMEDQVE
jgi:hypothetical protein